MRHSGRYFWTCSAPKAYLCIVFGVAKEKPPSNQAIREREHRVQEREKFALEDESVTCRCKFVCHDECGVALSAGLRLGKTLPVLPIERPEHGERLQRFPDSNMNAK